MVHFEPADETEARGGAAARGATSRRVAPVAYLPGASGTAGNGDADPVALAKAELRRLTGTPTTRTRSGTRAGAGTPAAGAAVTGIGAKRARASRSIPVPDNTVSDSPVFDSTASVDQHNVVDDGWAKPGEAGLSRASTGFDDVAYLPDDSTFYEDHAADAEQADAEQADAEQADAMEEEAEEEFDPVAEREHAETLLLGRLRSRSLSIQEATAVLGATDVTPEDIDEILAHFTDLAYLDDNKLADQIIHTHHARKGLGRSGVEAEMRRRKLDPFVIIEKLDELPDEELERATELALTRVRQLSRFDDQTADRRLTAFLQRKGYSSASVRAAVKTALATRLGSGRGSTVRFQ